MCALANPQGHVSLNGKTYVLIEESYEKRAQQPFSARFATGDPGYGDLSFWQFLKQETWDGGNGQETFLTTNKIYQSVGWNFQNYRPRLSCGAAQVAWKTPASFFVNTLPLIVKTQFNDTVHLFPFASLYRGVSGHIGEILHIVGATAWKVSSTATFLDPSDAENPAVKHIDSQTFGLWNRGVSAAADGYGPLILTAAYYLDGGISKVKLMSHSPNPSGPTDLGAIVQVGGYLDSGVNSVRVIFGIDRSHVGLIDCAQGAQLLKVLTMDDAFVPSITATKYLKLPGGAEVISNAVATDANGYVYCVTQNGAIPGNGGTNEFNISSVYIFSPTDLLAGHPVLTEHVHLPPGFYATGITDVAGAVYVLGAFKPSSTEQYAAIYKMSTGQIIWQSAYNYVGEDNYIRAFSRLSRAETIFVAKSNLGNYASILRLRSGDIVEEVAAIPAWTAGTHTVLGVGCYGHRYYWYTNDGGGVAKLYSTNDVSGALDATGTYSILELSDFGANTPLINKTAYAITVELSAALPSTQSIDVLVNDSVFGTMTSADGTSKEIVATSEFTATSFRIKLRQARANTWTGSLRKVALRFVPTQFKKRAWGFGIRATKRLKMGDGSHETRTPATMFTDIEAAWASNIPVTFIDVDGTSYSVLVTDFKQKRPLLSMDRQSGNEAFYFVELLQT